MLITNLISRYMELCKAAFLFCGGAKLNKSIQLNIMEMLFLLMVIPRKVNFTQMGNYSAPPMGMSNRLTVVLQQELH